MTSIRDESITAHLFYLNWWPVISSLLTYQPVVFALPCPATPKLVLSSSVCPSAFSLPTLRMSCAVLSHLSRYYVIFTPPLRPSLSRAFLLTSFDVPDYTGGYTDMCIYSCTRRAIAMLVAIALYVLIAIPIPSRILRSCECMRAVYCPHLRTPQSTSHVIALFAAHRPRPPLPAPMVGLPRRCTGSLAVLDDKALGARCNSATFDDDDDEEFLDTDRLRYSAPLSTFSPPRRVGLTRYFSARFLPLIRCSYTLGKKCFARVRGEKGLLKLAPVENRRSKYGCSMKLGNVLTSVCEIEFETSLPVEDWGINNVTIEQEEMKDLSKARGVYLIRY